MPQPTRFVVAVHVLTLLAHEHGKPLTSDYIAGSVNTNPVVIRRVLAQLSKAGLVNTLEGPGGGAELAWKPKEIALSEVFRAVESHEFFAFPTNDPNPLCPVGRSVQRVLGEHLAEFQELIEQSMGRVTIADILSEVRACKS